MSSLPPNSIYLIIWDNPFRVVVAQDVLDWDSSHDPPPKHYIRYDLAEYGDYSYTTHDIPTSEYPLDSKEEWKDNGDQGPVIN
jgi:hypothetical protein